MNFIRKIAEGKSDAWVKRQLTRYGKGTYEQKALLQIIKGKTSTRLSSSFEFAPDLAFALAETIQKKTRVSGGIITTQKLTEKEVGFSFAGMKQFAGVKTFLIDTELTVMQVQGLFAQYPSALILLSFKTEKGELKTKVKNPKSAKSKTSAKENELPKADFCSFTTQNQGIIDDYTFDIQKNFTKVFILHTFVIESLKIPQEYEHDFAHARTHAIRKGTLIREIHLDGKIIVKKYPFEV